MRSKIPVIAFLLILLVSSAAFSQRSRRNRFVPFTRETQFSLGAELVAVLPSGLGIGASFRYEQPLKLIDNLTVLASVGIITYGTSTTYGNAGTAYTAKSTAHIIPVLGGAKYYYPGPIFRGLYGSLEAGFGFGSSSVSYTGSTPSGPARPSLDQGIMVCPGAGYHNGQMDFSLRYFSIGIVSLRVAYVFKMR